MALQSQLRSIVTNSLITTIYRHSDKRNTLEELKITNYIINACNLCNELNDFFIVFPSFIHGSFPKGFHDAKEFAVTPTDEVLAFNLKNTEVIQLFKEQYTLSLLLKS